MTLLINQNAPDACGVEHSSRPVSLPSTANRTEMSTRILPPMMPQRGGAGRTLDQIWRQADITVYELRSENELLLGFELIVIRSRKERMRGKEFSYPAGEYYPSSENFGTYAWSFPRQSREEVLALANTLVAIPAKERSTYVRHRERKRRELTGTQVERLSFTNRPRSKFHLGLKRKREAPE